MGWFDDDSAFLSYLERGQKVERYVAKTLRGEGFDAVCPEQSVREDLSKAHEYRDQVDILVRSPNLLTPIRIEVKERPNLSFTSPKDIPNQVMPMFVTEKDVWDRVAKNALPHIIIIVSGLTGAMIAISAQSKPEWIVWDGYDSVRRFNRTWYAAERRHWRDYSQLVRWLRRATDGRIRSEEEVFEMAKKYREAS